MIIQFVRFTKNILLTSCALALFGSLNGSLAQSPGAETVRDAVVSGDLKQVAAQLEVLRATSPSIFTLNNYDYLTGRLAQRSGNSVSAGANYQAVVSRNSQLSGYALWHLAELARNTGDLVREREYLRRLIMRAPESLLNEPATMRLAQSFIESRDYPSVVATLQPLANSKNTVLARQALALTAEAYSRSGKTAEANELFSRLISEQKDPSRPDDFALMAAHALDRTSPGASEPISEATHLLRASIYQFNRDFDAARQHYLAVISKNPPGVNDATYQVGRGFYQQGKYAEALLFLQRASAEKSNTTVPRDALALQAATLIKLKRSDDAISAYKALIERFPDAPNPERPYLNIIDALRDAGRDAEALDWVKQARAHLAGQVGDALALFEQAKIHLAQSGWGAAIAELDELRSEKDLGGARVPFGTTLAEVLFLRAYALEQLGRTAEAIDAYLSVPEGRNEYYGFQANERLRILDRNSITHALIGSRATAFRDDAIKQFTSSEIEAARRSAQSALRLTSNNSSRAEIVDILKRVYGALQAYRLPEFQMLTLGRAQSRTEPVESSDTSHQALADELFFLGLSDEAVPEFELARGGSSANQKSSPTESGNQNIDYTLAVYSLRGELPFPAVRFAESFWRNVPSDFVLALAPKQLLDLLYPAPFQYDLLRYSSAERVDPRFVLSIARQESRFRADAKSVAAARGLMQFISATASDVARQLNVKDFAQENLYNPATALQFGSHYLGSLYTQFPSMPEAVAAAYNGGADNMGRWIARSHSQDVNRYVAEIGFSQSKDYVFRVMSNYWIYQQLYDQQMHRR